MNKYNFVYEHIVIDTLDSLVFKLYEFIFSFFSRLKLSAICGLENCAETLFSPVENVNLLPLLLVLAHHVALRHLVPTVRPGIYS